jgi:hypothetical protein
MFVDVKKWEITCVICQLCGSVKPVYTRPQSFYLYIFIMLYQILQCILGTNLINMEEVN